MLFMSLLTLLKITHLVGLIMGLGGAVLADATIFSRGVVQPVTAYTLHQTEFLSRIVAIGLGILWLSGLALIWVNWTANPEYLTNQKLWAKIAIVMVLTINGVALHKMVLPILHKSIGLRLFDDVSTTKLLGMTFIGAVSLVSWSVPFVLGKAVELNYVTPLWVILLVYFNLVLAAWIGLFAVMGSIRQIEEIVLRATRHTQLPSELWEKNAAIPESGTHGSVILFSPLAKAA